MNVNMELVFDIVFNNEKSFDDITVEKAKMLVCTYKPAIEQSNIITPIEIDNGRELCNLVYNNIIEMIITAKYTMFQNRKNSKKKIIEILNNFNIGTKNLPDAIKWHCAYYWKHIFTKKECLEVKFTYNLLKSTIAIPILFTKKKLIYKKIASKINNIIYAVLEFPKNQSQTYSNVTLEYNFDNKKLYMSFYKIDQKKLSQKVYVTSTLVVESLLKQQVAGENPIKIVKENIKISGEKVFPDKLSGKSIILESSISPNTEMKRSNKVNS